MSHVAAWIVIEEADYLLGCGEPFPSVAARLNLKPESLAVALTRNGRHDLIPEGWKK